MLTAAKNLMLNGACLCVSLVLYRVVGFRICEGFENFSACEGVAI